MSVTIKLIDNPDNPKLKAKYIGAKEYAVVKTGKDGKYLTGLDENAFDVVSIPDAAVRKSLQTKIKKDREELEKLLGVELGPTSPFWDKFFVILSDEEISLDETNALDRVKEAYLTANRYVAPYKDAIDEDERYHHCIFYFYREKEEATKKAKTEQDHDKAIGKLISLNESNPAQLKLIGAYVLGLEGEDFSIEQWYTKIREFLNVEDIKRQRSNNSLFLEIAAKKPEELQIKIILDKAIRKRVVNAKRGIHRYGDTHLGDSFEEALSYLGSPEGSGDLRSLKQEITAQ